MLCARATLTAGSGHRRYRPGTKVQAWVFARGASHPQDLRDKPQLQALVPRGFTRISFYGHKVLDDDHQFASPTSPEAQAFRGALESGLAIAVIGPVQ